MNDSTYNALYDSLINDYNKLSVTGDLKNLTVYDAEYICKKYDHMTSREYTHSIYTVFKQEKEYPISVEEIGYKYIPYTITLIDHTEKGFGIYKAVLINKQKGKWVVYNKDTKSLQYVKAKIYVTNDKIESAIYNESWQERERLLLPSSICDTFLLSASDYGISSYDKYNGRFKIAKSGDNAGITEDILFLSLYSCTYFKELYVKYTENNPLISEHSLSAFIRDNCNQIPMYKREYDTNTDTAKLIRVTPEIANAMIGAYELNVSKDVFMQIPKINAEDFIKIVTSSFADLIKTFGYEQYHSREKYRGRTGKGIEFKLLADDSEVKRRTHQDVDSAFISEFFKSISPIYEFIAPTYLIITDLPFEEPMEIVNVRKLINALGRYHSNLSILNDESNYMATERARYDYIFKSCIEELIKTYPSIEDDFLEVPTGFYDSATSDSIIAINKVDKDLEVIIKEKGRFKKSTLSEVCRSKLNIFTNPSYAIDDANSKEKLIGYCKEIYNGDEYVVLQVSLENEQHININAKDLEYLIGFTLNKKEQAKAKLISGINMTVSQDNRIIQVKGIPDDCTTFNMPPSIVGAEKKALALLIDKGVETITYSDRFAETQKLYLCAFEWDTWSVSAYRRNLTKHLINVTIDTKDLKVVNNIITNHVIATPYLFSNVVRHMMSETSNSDYINFNLNPNEKEWNLSFLLTLTTNEVYVLTFMSDINTYKEVCVDPENTSKIHYEDVQVESELSHYFIESEYRTPCISRFITSQVYDSDTALEYLGYDGVVMFVQTYFNTIDKLAKVPIKLDKLGFTRYTKFLNKDTTLSANIHTISLFSAQFRRYYATLMKGISLYLLVFRNALSDEDVLKFDNNLIRLVNDIRKLKDECLEYIENDFKNIESSQTRFMRSLSEIYSIFKLENTVLDTLFTHMMLNKGIKLDWSKTNVVDNLVTMANVIELLK